MDLFERLEKEMAEKHIADRYAESELAAWKDSVRGAIQFFVSIACLCGSVLAIAGTVRLLMWWF